MSFLGLMESPVDALWDLCHKILTMPAGSWFVDEFVMTNPEEHTKWAEDLQNLRYYMASQPDRPLLWISMAGVMWGGPEHLKRSYLTPLMSGFHVPDMKIPLRNTMSVMRLAKMDREDTNRITNVTTMKTSSSYSLPSSLMTGLECIEIKVKRESAIEATPEVDRAVEAACKLLLERNEGKGFPVFLDDLNVEPSSVVTAIKRVVGKVLIYEGLGTRRQKKHSTEAEVEVWLKRWKSGQEKRVLVTDRYRSRGWETSSSLVIAFRDWENLVMRTTSFCVLIKKEEVY